MVWLLSNLNLSRVVRLPVSRVSDQVKHKTSCTATDLILQISEVDGLYYVYGKNKDADQQRNCCAADMYHCFVHVQKGRFSLDSGHLYLKCNDLKWHLLHNIE